MDSQESSTNDRLTDKIFIFIFLLAFIAWSSICFSALFSDEGTEGMDDVRLMQYMFKIKSFLLLCSNITTRLDGVLLIVLMSMVFTLAWMLLIWKFKKFFIFVGTFIQIVSIFDTGYAIISHMSEGRDMLNLDAITAVVWIFLRVISVIAGIASVYKIGINQSLEIIGNSFEAIFDNPLRTLSYFYILILEYAVLIFMAFAVYAEFTSDHEASRIIFCLTVIILGGLTVLHFIHKFAVMVVSHFIVNYHWKSYEKPQIGQSINQTFRNHIGTISFASILPISWICAIFQALKHKASWEREENYIFYFISKIFLVLSMPINALIFSSINGTDFVKSSHSAFDTVLRHCVLYLATTWIFEILAASLGAVEFAGNLLQKLVEGEPLIEANQLLFEDFLDPFDPFADTFFSLVYVSTRALLINQIINLNNEI